MTQSSEKRINKRIPYKMQVDCQCEDNFIIEYSTNISESGIFIKSDNPLPPGTKIELTFSHQHTCEKVEIKAQGEVIWVNESRSDGDSNPGMGIKFTNINDRSRDRIINLVKRVAIL